MSWTVLTGIGAWPWLSEALALVSDDRWGSGQQVSCLTEESVSGCPGLINSALVTNDSQLALSNQGNGKTPKGFINISITTFINYASK